GCDASILLDETPTIVSEKTALPNLGSARGYSIIEDAKRELEKTCPGIVSCADILAVAARDASTLVGGPSWTVKLGRRDSTTASHTLAETDLPAPLDLVTPNQLDNNYFKNLRQRKGLLQSDQVLLSGGSTDDIVLEYSNSPRAFASDFAAAMIRMGDISPLTGQNGIIRSVCGSIN
ncbi:hypothetical protein HAX54_033205, partial [Datura stramonium]|nr:hypothetical protein [Datura stramonium]